MHTTDRILRRYFGVQIAQLAALLNTGLNTRNDQIFPAYNPAVMVSWLHRAVMPANMGETFEFVYFQSYGILLAGSMDVQRTI